MTTKKQDDQQQEVAEDMSPEVVNKITPEGIKKLMDSLPAHASIPPDALDKAKADHIAMYGPPPPPVPPEDGNRELTEEEIGVMAEQMGVPRAQLAGKIIKMSPEFIEQMKQGKIKFQRRDVQTPAVAPPSAPEGFRPPSPRQRIEQHYQGVLQKAMQMRRTSALPTTVVGREGNSEAAAQDLGDNNSKPVISAFMEQSERLLGAPSQRRPVLAIRPPGAPNILRECRFPVKLFISQHQSPGDILMLSRAVDDLHRSYPGKFITMMRTPAMDIWQNNPNHTKIEDNDPEAMWLEANYKLINTANRGAHHFCHGFRKELEAKLGLPIDQTHPHGAIYLSDQERSWYSQIWEIVGKNIPYWIIDAGRKSDYTAKFWEVCRFQELVDKTPDITWVQIGANTDQKNPHIHPPLAGDNVINLIGKTTIRQLIRLVYHSAGVVTPVSFPMHLAAAVPMHPRYRRQTRPCVVIAGGREPAMWEAYSTHQFLHTCGMLPCCSHGGCWKSRVIPLGDGDDKDYNDIKVDENGNRTIITRLCEMPVVAGSGQIIPKCMDMITADMVVNAVRWYLADYDYSNDDDTQWTSNWPYTKPAGAQEVIDDVLQRTEAGEIVRKNNVTNSAAQPDNTQTPEPPKPEAKEQEHAPEPEKKEEAEQEPAETPEAENGEVRQGDRGLQPGGGIPPAGEVLAQGEEAGVQGQEAVLSEDSPEEEPVDPEPGKTE